MDLFEKVVNLEQNAESFGFRWENTTQIMAQIKSECAEIQEHLPTNAPIKNPQALQEEIGDLLHAVFSLCVYCQFDPKTTLQNTLNKFEQRLNTVKSIAKEQGIHNLNGYPFEELMRFWDEAKLRLATSASQ